ncbi:MAG: hypothetical protein JRE43_03890 [Deltaproteobacteria bacterium]|jgi:hypothetical protein|nr:hypothetical protein [Deltaproteobacteria bacterium]MBW2541275.1 hypothetical protein [Deltaproteobacteria bacterium]
MIEELVQEAGALIVFLAGISYVAVGIYLLQTAARENGGPSFFLGWALLCNGISFGLSEIGFVADTEQLIEPLTFASRVCSAACSVSIALFAWRVFRRQSRWGGAAVGLIFGLIASGLTISALEGDWEGYSPLSSRGFWFEWVGSTAPFLWLASESIREYLISRRRIPLGLIDPVICNRYFLIGFYASLASLTYVIYIPMYIVYELHGVWSGWLDLSLGVVEVVSVMALALAFSTPRFYRKWLNASGSESANR